MLHARRWSWVLVLVVGIVLYEVVLHAVVGTGNPNLVPALILLGAAVVIRRVPLSRQVARGASAPVSRGTSTIMSTNS